MVNLFRGLRKDIKDHKEEIAQLKAEMVRLNRVLALEQEERKEALKAEWEEWEEALEAEREKWEEALTTALKAERAKQEEALTAALKAEREERDEALKVKREERERECAQRQSEKAEADKKYELLKSHLLDVEEATMDTVDWIANNVGHQLFNFCM